MKLTWTMVFGLMVLASGCFPTGAEMGFVGGPVEGVVGETVEVTATGTIGGRADWQAMVWPEASDPNLLRRADVISGSPGKPVLMSDSVFVHQGNRDDNALNLEMAFDSTGDLPLDLTIELVCKREGTTDLELLWNMQDTGGHTTYSGPASETIVVNCVE